MGMDDDYLASGTLGAMSQMFDALAEAADRFASRRPEWFNATVHSKVGAMSVLRDIVRQRKAADRAEAHMKALRTAGLAPLPGWTAACSASGTEEVGLEHFTESFTAEIFKNPQDCHLLAFLGLSSSARGTRVAAAVASATHRADADGSGSLSVSE